MSIAHRFPDHDLYRFTDGFEKEVSFLRSAKVQTIGPGAGSDSALLLLFALSACTCHRNRVRVTLSYMKDAAVTIRLDAVLQRQLDKVCHQLGRSRSEVVRDALRRQLTLLRFERARRRLMPYAEARGYLTDEDVFRDVS